MRHGEKYLLGLAATVAIVVAAVTGIMILNRDDDPSETPPGAPIVVPIGEAGAISIPAGKQLIIDFGRYNGSAGDSWTLVTKPDPLILEDHGTLLDRENACPKDADGCSSTLAWQFLALKAGTTTMRFQYCYRSSPPKCDAEPSRGPKDPVEATVTVT